MTSFNIALTYDGKWYVAHCLDLPVVSQGLSPEEARANVQEAIELYLETWGRDEVVSTVGEPELMKVLVAG